ncbi:hypothetical protein LXA43DRAFT_390079 [Ganoderma leucocontextum]|nr:hypothetical protein LXA43DRAFT_390079 [Ganoderma leucocontextum]
MRRLRCRPHYLPANDRPSTSQSTVWTKNKKKKHAPHSAWPGGFKLQPASLSRMHVRPFQLPTDRTVTGCWVDVPVPVPGTSDAKFCQTAVAAAAVCSLSRASLGRQLSLGVVFTPNARRCGVHVHVQTICSGRGLMDGRARAGVGCPVEVGTGNRLSGEWRTGGGRWLACSESGDADGGRRSTEDVWEGQCSLRAREREREDRT